MPASSMEQISIGLLLIRKYNIFCWGASSPCNGNHFLVVKRHNKPYLRARSIIVHVCNKGCEEYRKSHNVSGPFILARLALR